MTDYTYEILKLLSDNDGSMDVSLIMDSLIKDKEQPEAGQIQQKAYSVIVGMWSAEKKFINQIPVSLGAELSNRYYNQSLRHIDDEISIDITITQEGVNEYRRLDSIHNPPPQVIPEYHTHQTFTTYGHGSPIAGHDLKMEDVKVNDTVDEKKNSKPKWLTFTFYWEELIKMGWKAIVAAAVVILLTYLGLRPSSNKESKEPESKQTPVQTDSTNKKDSVVR